MAVVAIRAAQGDGIISKAKESKTKTEQAKAEEQTQLQNYLNILNENTPISTEKSYVGYYADVDGDKEPDGVIYVDKAKSENGEWNENSYTVTTVTTGLKDYYVSKQAYEGVFGTADVLTATGKGEERFYVMALEDIKTGSDSIFCYWYFNATNGISDYETLTTTGLGTGKSNTSKMITEYNVGTYGGQNDIDMWKVIQGKNKDDWYVPSKDEWLAFAAAFNVMASNYESFGLRACYWSSSLNSSSHAWGIDFYYNYVIGSGFALNNFVRLGTTF